MPADNAGQPASSDADMSAAQPGNDTAAQPGKIPVIEVAFKGGMWWSIPPWLSMPLYEKYVEGQDAVYTWDWAESRTGSWVNDGEETSINRYVIDFNAMEQKNIDNGRLRTIRIAWVDHADEAPRWTGQIPE